MVAVVLIAIFTGVIGGIIGNLWGKEFAVGRDDKFDIFSSLLVSLFTVLGLVFGGLGLAAYSRLFGLLDKRAEDLNNKLEKQVQRKLTDLSHGVDLRTVDSQEYLGRMYYNMAMEASTKQETQELAKVHFAQVGYLLRTALSQALDYLPYHMDDETERLLVLDIKNTLAMSYARMEDLSRQIEAHQLAEDVLPWGKRQYLAVLGDTLLC